MATSQDPSIPSPSPPYDIPSLLAIPIHNPLPIGAITSLISQPPFLPLPLALNLRSVPLPSTSKLKFYRSGYLHPLSPDSLSVLHSKYNVTQIYDLRQRAEREKQPSPSIEGVETVWTENTEDAGLEKEDVKLVPVTEFAGDGMVGAYVKRYENVLRMYGCVYRRVFETILKGGDGEGILFHCSAGKDRTGILSALLLALVDTPAEVIAEDYALTRIGTEPYQEVLFAHLCRYMGINPEKAAEMPGLIEMCSSDGSVMVGFLEWMEEQWGGESESKGKWKGVDGWLKKELGFTKEEVSVLRKNLGGDEAR